MTIRKSATLVLIALTLQAVSVLASEVTVTIDGMAVHFADQGPIISDNRTLVPVRGVFEQLGFYVSWTMATQTATLSDANFTLEITADSATFFVNGEARTLDVPAQIVNDRTLLPLRAVVEAVGHSIGWDEFTQTVSITTRADDVTDDVPDDISAEWFDSPVVVNTIAGTGLPGSIDGELATFYLPGGLFMIDDDVPRVGAGLIVADTGNNLVRVVGLGPGTSASTIAGNVLAAGDDGFPRGRHVDGPVADAHFNRPADGAIGSDGRIFIADSGNDAIRTIVGGNVYTFATGFNGPSAIAFGPCGNLFVADTLNHAIRAVSPEGEVSTVAGLVGTSGFTNGAANAARFNAPMGIAVCGDGVIFVADTGNHLIRVIEDGYVRTLAGTRTISPEFDNEPLGGFANGASPEFNLPVGLALWNENIIVADSGNNAIRLITPEGEATTLAGTGYAGHDDGTATTAEFHLPRGVFVRQNTLYIADTGNNLIRRIFLG